MFISLLNGETAGVSVVSLILLFISSIASGLIIALFYRRFTTSSKAFSVTITVLPAIVMIVIMMVNGNLGTGLAVAGSFSLVRFRSIPGKSSDIAVIFLAMACGLVSSMGYGWLAVVIALLTSAVMTVLAKVHLFDAEDGHRYLTIEIPEDLDYSSLFTDLFSQYTSSCKMTEVKTINLGSLYELKYEIVLKDVSQEKELIDAVRTRNGNLSVASTLRAPLDAQL